MVFQKKLPGPAPRPRRSAQQLAQELGLDISFVMDALQSVASTSTHPASAPSKSQPSRRSISIWTGPTRLNQRSQYPTGSVVTTDVLHQQRHGKRHKILADQSKAHGLSKLQIPP